MDNEQRKKIIEATLMSASQALNVDQLLKLFADDTDEVTRDEIKVIVQSLQEDCQGRGYELKKVASGFRYQTREEMQPWVDKLRPERAPRYSRAFMETLALVVYKQPITRAEIEDVRGVAVSSSIFKVLLEREWVKIIGHKEVPGRPAMYGTTRKLLDYFNLSSLNELPDLAEIKDIDDIAPELALIVNEEIPEQQQIESMDPPPGETHH
ncbi:MAG: SMC-Scp complex subunit ScpB [Gammaproteobacteria bacterium]|nr:SMC-Scp complex subunit ScpB [Gammaproteobacteria bacterium]